MDSSKKREGTDHSWALQLNTQIPGDLYFEDEEDFISWAHDHLPTAICREAVPTGLISLSIFTPTRSSKKVETFLMDLIRIWFLSDHIQLRSLEYTPLILKKKSDQSFLIAEYIFFSEKKNDFEKIQKSLPLILKEIELYLSSSRSAEAFLRLSMLSSQDELYFHEALLHLLHRWPDDFDQDLIQDYHYFLGLSQKDFKNHRSRRHQLRLICSLYLMRKKLLPQLALSPQKLHLEMRIIPTHLQFPFCKKAILGIAIAIHLPTPYERFEDHHVLRAVHKLIPWTQGIKESFLPFHQSGTSLRSLYLEIEKTNDAPFTREEIALLKHNLKAELVKSVEVLSPSIFGSCDVEEVMRNTILLGQELQTLSDLPQVMISFEGSSAKNLVFRVIVVRFLSDQSQPLPSYFQLLEEPFEYIPERSSVIGYIGQGEKEATVFRLQIPKAPFLLRSNSSLNIYRARQYIDSLLTKALGDIRDYNGGIFAKQVELFLQLKQFFKNEDSELLEDFFYSIQPPESQAILPLTSLKTLFQLLLKAKNINFSQDNDYLFETKEEGPFFFALIHLQDSSFQEKVTEALIQANLLQELTAQTSIKHSHSLLLGYIYRSSFGKQKSLFQVLQHTLEEWKTEKHNSQILHLDLEALPLSLDPRLGGDCISGILLKMLFEGLMRIGKDGKPHLGVAENVTISEEGKKYTFTLRSCFWNNGDPVKASDFCYSWRTILSPQFTTTYAYLFYIIKNAKKVKKGVLPLEEVGLEARDDQTLIVHLEHPCSYFLELTTHPLYSPVHHQIDRFFPNWPLQSGKAYICNGPFYLEHAKESYILRKNPMYWDRSNIQLDSVQFIKASAKKALQMFQKGTLDWLGRPSRPWEPSFSSSIQQKIVKLSPSVTCWCVCNTQHPLLGSPKLRQALADALDRLEIIQQLSADLIPAQSPLPFIHSHFQGLPQNTTPGLAKALFQEALQNLRIELSQIPPLTLLHTDTEIRKQTAAAMIKQWKEVLGITIHSEICPLSEIFTKLTHGSYQLSLIMWRAWADDPLYTLDTFKCSTEEINFSKWQHPHYQQLINQAIEKSTAEERQIFLKAAEKTLIQEVPVIPIYHEIEMFSAVKDVEGITVSRLGDIDFKYASLKRRPYEHI